jgi:hypothetical protein
VIILANYRRPLSLLAVPILTSAPPLFPPSVSPYFFAINGVAVPPAQHSVLFSNPNSDLFAAARALNSATVNVDVLAYIPSAYMSHLDIISVVPNPPFLPTTVGGGRLMPQQITIPAYFPAEAVGAAVIVLHADAQHPCPIRQVSGLNMIDEGCLTQAGQLLKSALLSDVANHVIAGPPGTSRTYNLPLMSALQDCFGPGVPFPIANVHIDVSSASAQASATYSLSLPMPMIALPLVQGSETADLPSWQQAKVARIAALSTNGPVLAGSGACAPHIP